MKQFSHSRLSTFEQCPLKFKYRYIDKLEVSQEGVEAFLGSRVHGVLEKLYKDLKLSKLNSLQELIEFLREEWKKNWHDDIVIIREGITKENYLATAEKFVKDYYETYKPFKSNVIATEKKIKIDLGDGYSLIGYIDRLDFGEDYEIHDYKTSGSLTPQEYLDQDRQLALYALAVKNEFDDAKNVKLVWHFLAFNKEFTSFRTDEDLEELKSKIAELAKKIDLCTEFKPKESALCSWCEFKKICPKFRHLYVAEEDENGYLENDGVKLVNQYAKLDAEKKRTIEVIDQELEKIKEAIIKFSEKNKVDVLFGSDKKIRVWTKDCVKFPGKNEPEQQALKDVLIKEGKYIDVSAIDTFKLAKIVEEKKWPEQILDKIKRYQFLEKVQRLYLSKIK